MDQLFPATQGISKNLSLRKIVLKRCLIFERSDKGLFGLYAEMNKDAVIMNENCSQKFAGILLGPTVNIQGTQKVLISKLA